MNINVVHVRDGVSGLDLQLVVESVLYNYQHTVANE